MDGWENAEARIGVWYGDGDVRNIFLRLETDDKRIASNSRARLGAILEALRHNEKDDFMVIESDLLTSLRGICNQSEKYEDMNWSGTQNADLKGHLLSHQVENRSLFNLEFTLPAAATDKMPAGYASRDALL